MRTWKSWQASTPCCSKQQKRSFGHCTNVQHFGGGGGGEQQLQPRNMPQCQTLTPGAASTTNCSRSGHSTQARSSQRRRSRSTAWSCSPRPTSSSATGPALACTSSSANVRRCSSSSSCSNRPPLRLVKMAQKVTASTTATRGTWLCFAVFSLVAVRVFPSRSCLPSRCFRSAADVGVAFVAVYTLLVDFWTIPIHITNLSTIFCQMNDFETILEPDLNLAYLFTIFCQINILETILKPYLHITVNPYIVE